MKDLLALTIDGFDQPIEAPPTVPSGGSGTFGEVLNIGIALFVILAIVTALIFVIWGGIRWATSGGDKERIDKARKTIIYAIVAIVLTVLSFVILQIIGQLLGSEFLANF